jgi:hypothetical protein
MNVPRKPQFETHNTISLVYTEALVYQGTTGIWSWNINALTRVQYHTYVGIKGLGRVSAVAICMACEISPHMLTRDVIWLTP